MKVHINWKNVWQMVSGLHQDTPLEKVRSTLLEVKDSLFEGLLQFKEVEPESKLEKLLQDARQEKLLSITRHLQNRLNLDAEQTWSTLCSYLINEYKGSPGSLSTYAANEVNRNKLIVDIWNYYCLERMIILKLIKTLLEFHDDKRHPYHGIYAEILQSIGLQTLKAKIIDQLIRALQNDSEYTDADVKQSGMLVARKLREINELIHLLTLIAHEEEIANPEELQRIINTLKGSAFLQKCKYYAPVDCSDLVGNVESSRNILVMIYIRQCPSDIRDWPSGVLKKVDDSILSAQHYIENAPMFLSWMIKMKSIGCGNMAGETSNIRNFEMYGVLAIKLGVYRYLGSVLQSRTYQSKPHNLLAYAARWAVYQTLNDLCDLFDADGSIGHHNGIYELFAELLKTTPIAVDFMGRYNEHHQKGCVSLYNTAIELFPAEFEPICLIASSLAEGASKTGSEFIKIQLESLPVYTEAYQDKQYDLQPIGSDEGSEDEFVVTKDYFPSRQFGLKIPRKTRVAIVDRRNKTYVHFWHPCNFFHILQNHIRELLLSADAGDQPLIDRVTAGVNYLRYMLRKMKSPGDITDAMVHPVEMVFDLLLKFKDIPYPPIALMAGCLEVCAALSVFFEQEVLNRVINLGILPSVSGASFTFEEYARGTSFDPGLIGQYLINYENANGTYPFLRAYLSLLMAYKSNYTVELPALLFMLREVFPHCHTWRFEKEADLHDIYEFAMNFFFEILQSEESGNPQTKLLRDVCVFSLLNLENGLTLLKFVGVGNAFLQSKMESESNWSLAISTGLNHIVQLSMTILMQILRKKGIVTDENTLSPLETIIYTQPKQRDTLRIIPVVTSYMNNIFNNRLPILACRLLRRFAIEFKMSLLACLDMEQDHIRVTFLQRLRDDTGSNELKIAIVEFVEACLEKQPGLVEAFFDIRYTDGLDKKRFKVHTAGIPEYMEEYLDAISKYPEKVASPLLSRIMSLFHVVWRHNMQSLIRNLVERKSFWPSLCTPLFMQINTQSLKVYSQLFNVLGLEVFKYNDTPLNPELEQTLKKFLDLECFESWLKYLLENRSETNPDLSGCANETPEWLCRMQSFKDFLCIVIKKRPTLMSTNARSLLLNRLVIEILCRIEDNRSDCRPLVILAELYLMVLANSDTPKYTNDLSEDKRLFNDISQILSFLAASYEEMIPRVRVAIIGFSLRVVLAYNEALGEHSGVGTNLVQSIISIICLELAWVENDADGKPNEALLLALQMLQKLFMINSQRKFLNWDKVSVGPKILFRFLGSLQRICPKYHDRRVTLAMLEVLTAIALTLDSNEFLYCDIGDYLWLQLLPPTRLLKGPFYKNEATNQLNGWTIQEWWPIYGQGIELVTVLLQKHGSLFIHQAISFLGIHEGSLTDSLHLVRESLEPRAMSLIKKTVSLVCECTRFRQTWQLEHPQSTSSLMRSIQVLTEQLISLMYRPNLLKMLLNGRPFGDALIDLSAPISATPELVSALNGVIAIIVLCIKALLAFSPPLMELICSRTFVPSQWHALIEIQFGAPKFHDSIQRLSFGTLLSSIGTFTKTLALIHYSAHASPLNFSHGDDDGESQNNSTAMSLSTITPKVTSVTRPANQSVANCNDLLSNLDGKLCMVALEHILTLLLSQSYLAIKEVHLSVRDKQLIKRELCAEMGILNDFLKKKLLLENIGTFERKKLGSVPVTIDLGESCPRTSKSVSAQPQQRRLSQPRDSMRVNVVRRLHLQQKVMPNVHGSTPQKSGGQSVTFDNITPIKRDRGRFELDPNIEYYDVEDPFTIGLSNVKLIEADYLHLLSNLFAVICHSEK